MEKFDNLKWNLWYQFWGQVAHQTGYQIKAYIGDQVWREVGYQVRYKIGTQDGGQVWVQVWNQLKKEKI